MSERQITVQVYAAAADIDAANRIARALEADAFSIANGSAATTRDAVLVVWSPAAAASKSLVEAARVALAEGTLASVAIAPVRPPSEFRGIETVDLERWSGDRNDLEWQRARAEVRRAASARALDAPDPAAAVGDLFREAEAPAPVARQTRARRARAAVTGGRAMAATAALFLVVISGGFGFLAFRAINAPSIPARIPAIEARSTASEEIPVLAPLIVGAFTPLPDPPAVEARVAENAAADPRGAASSSDGADFPKPGAPRLRPRRTADASPLQTMTAAERLDPPQAEAIPQPDKSQSARRGAYGGDFFKDCAECPEMSAIPAGAFLMGAPIDEPARAAEDADPHPVTIAQRFAMGTREVTFEQWDACVADGGCSGYVPPDQGWGRGRRPAIGISWSDAADYVRWLSQKTGRRYRLPSEAEWEYAARAGTQSPFSFGESATPALANFDGRMAYGARPGRYRAETTPVGSFGANAFGLFDMHGNVWEWTQNCAAAVATDCADRLLKGGAWSTGGWRLRAGHRLAKDEGARDADTGFRVAADLE